MKYLFINSVVGIGSTGRIVADKCRELAAQGHECVAAYGRGKANCDDLTTIQIGTGTDCMLHGVKTRLLDQHGFGSYQATRRFLQQVQAYDPDVIWLHNIHGYYIHIGLLFVYLKSCGKRIFWTLHDCWAFTGHCSYFDFIGCDRWKTGCFSCPQKREYPSSLLLDRCHSNYAEKRRLFTGISNMTLITPSKWLAGLLSESFLKGYPVEVVYNTINTDIFEPTPSDFRKKHGLEEKKIILGVANIWEARKGLGDFVKLAEMLDDRFCIVLVGLTEEQAEKMPPNVLAIPRTNTPQELAMIYTAADVFFNPTYEDNYPTVNLEAQACGTRVVTYDTGGAKETLKYHGVAIPQGSIGEFVNLIENEGTEKK